MEQQQELVTKHVESFGAEVTRQEFEARNPETGKATALANLIVEFHPDRKRRVLLCAHYDTRPFPDEDPDPAKRRDVFLGANDGASGVALLMELATHIGDYKGPLGIDFVLFDAEELVYDRQRDKYFLGSEYFAQQYVGKPPAHKYICGVLLTWWPTGICRFIKNGPVLSPARFARSRMGFGTRLNGWACETSFRSHVTISRTITSP